MKLYSLLLTLALAAVAVMSGDEGMWTFDNPPVKQLGEKYHFTPTEAWLNHVRLASVRLNDGGSGSFVSAHGLLLTNHHVARGQLQKNSTAAHDYIRNGFYAAAEDAEMKSQDLEVNVLVSTENVTARVQEALKNAGGETQFSARKAVLAAISAERTRRDPALRWDVVTLYQGGEYWVYGYRRYTDVRLVFAPEEQAAFFGGDPDNFTYPRYDLDMALFRVYENGKPLETKDYLKWNAAGAKEGDLTLVSGHPGSTLRLNTMAQIAFERDFREPAMIRLLKNRIAALEGFSALSPEQARRADGQILSAQNSLKVYEGRYQGLEDPRLMAQKQKAEDDFRAQVNSNAKWKEEFGGAWDQIAAAEARKATRVKQQIFLTANSELANTATTIVDYVAEVGKPDKDRLAQFHDSQLESLRYKLFSAAPVYADLERARMTAALQLAAAELGASDPYVAILLDGKTPEAAAAMWIGGSKLGDPAVRRRLIEGGEAAVAASDDSMIVLERRLDPLRRVAVKWNEENVLSPEQKAGELLGRARFAVYGKNAYPDATFTLRLSYGQVAGYPMNGTKAPPHTTFYGLFDRAASFDYEGPFALPSRYMEGKQKLDLATPLNFVTTNDIIGGNSGSPVINREGEIVGLIFDGDIESLVGDFVYDDTANRAIAVTTNGMTEALRKLYGAGKLVDELTEGK